MIGIADRSKVSWYDDSAGDDAPCCWKGRLGVDSIEILGVLLSLQLSWPVMLHPSVLIFARTREVLGPIIARGDVGERW